MFMCRSILFASALLTCLITNAAEYEPVPKRGKPASTEHIQAWNLSVYPDGRGLPIGQGGVKEGESLYAMHCSTCHGERGIGGSAEELSGGMQGLTGEYPDKTIGTYWPYAPTLFDFIRRSMPLYAPGSLSVNETYAVVAYLLFVNEVIKEDMTITQENLALIKMPNRDGFIPAYPLPAASED